MELGKGRDRVTIPFSHPSRPEGLLCPETKKDCSLINCIKDLRMVVSTRNVK